MLLVLAGVKIQDHSTSRWFLQSKCLIQPHSPAEAANLSYASAVPVHQCKNPGVKPHSLASAAAKSVQCLTLQWSGWGPLLTPQFRFTWGPVLCSCLQLPRCLQWKRSVCLHLKVPVLVVILTCQPVSAQASQAHCTSPWEMTLFGLLWGAPQLVKGKTGLAQKSLKSSQSGLFYKTLFQQPASAGEGRQSAQQEGQLVPSVCVGGKPHQAA